jgi:hypothetical protein
VDRVILADQRLRVGTEDMGDATDVPPGVEVATTRRIVVALDPLDDRFPDAGPLADLGDGETGVAACLRQGFPNAHARASTGPPRCAPPLTAEYRRS